MCCLSIPEVLEECYCGFGDIPEVLCIEELVFFFFFLFFAFSPPFSTAEAERNENTQQLKLSHKLPYVGNHCISFFFVCLLLLLFGLVFFGLLSQAVSKSRKPFSEAY